MKYCAIARKEFRGFFASPAAFLFLGAFLAVTLFIVLLGRDLLRPQHRRRAAAVPVDAGAADLPGRPR